MCPWMNNRFDPPFALLSLHWRFMRYTSCECNGTIILDSVKVWVDGHRVATLLGTAKILEYKKTLSTFNCLFLTGNCWISHKVSRNVFTEKKHLNCKLYYITLHCRERKKVLMFKKIDIKTVEYITLETGCPKILFTATYM